MLITSNYYKNYNNYNADNTNDNDDNDNNENNYDINYNDICDLRFKDLARSF